MLQVLTGWVERSWVRPRAPEQPRRGPGGMEYAHTHVQTSVERVGKLKYWLFEPVSPRPSHPTVVLFLPGWGGIHPAPYQAWIDHIVRRGHIVIYPIYQKRLLEFLWNFTSNSVEILAGTLQKLKRRRNGWRPDLERVAIVGHSAGGTVAANLAAEWEERGLPKPVAVMAVQPGGGTRGGLGIPLADYSRIAPDTLLLAVAGEDDGVVGRRDALRIFRGASNVPARNRNYVLFRTDRRGRPWIHSGHFSPCTMGYRRISAVDWYGYWKLFDGLCDAAFQGRNRKYALGNTPEQRHMGVWSDGTPVRELEVFDDPAI